MYIKAFRCFKTTKSGAVFDSKNRQSQNRPLIFDVDYTYAANGLRSTKTVNGVKSEYLYLDGQLVYEKRGNVGYYYFYDANGHFAGLKWFDEQGEPHAYYALTNSMGDVLGLYTNTGELVASYEYDTWGQVISVKDGTGIDIDDTTHVGNINPIRYRGYYYDTETKLYYLQSRYYNPEVGRFLNADIVISDIGEKILGNNMFSYCFNNPIFYIDSNGAWTVSIMVTGNATIGVGVLGAVGVAFDSMGTFEYQYSVACPNINDSFSIGGIDAGIGISVQITRAKSVENLHGLGTAVGFSAGTGGYVGIDAISLESISASMSNDNQQFDGVQFTVGYGVGVDAHVNQTYTNSFKSPWETMIDTMQKFVDELYKLL